MTENKQSPRVHIHENHIPQVLPGDYSVEVTGSVSHAKDSHGKKEISEDLDEKKLKFAVFGERFSLNPLEVRAVFPADKSTGEYSTILPHVILNRNTLPWERHAVSAAELEDRTPWLALLLFDEDEVPIRKVIQVATLKNNSPSDTDGHYPDFAIETAQHEGDKLTVIEVRKETLDKLLPTKNELSFLAHTRQGVTDEVNPTVVGEENAVVCCNRLPQQGKRSTMHLVSLEDRYDNESGFIYPSVADENPLIRLVSLKSWEFYTLEHFKITTDGLEEFGNVATENDLGDLYTLLDRDFAGTEVNFLNEMKQVMGIDNLPDEYKTSLLTHFKFDKTFDGLMSKLNKDLLTFRLPSTDNDEVEQKYKHGLVPLEHHFRNGDQSVSWYRGPFIPFGGVGFEADIDIASRSPKTSDDLLRYDPEKGMFDVTYASAWELGRLLAVSDKDFSVALFQWGHLKNQHVHRQVQQEALSHIPTYNTESSEEEANGLLETHLIPFLEKLITFEKIPSNYLVPDERLLPKESIRFFNVDEHWLETLVLGAFSVSAETEDRAAEKATQVNMLVGERPLMGLLLRSDVVDGWPGILIDGISKEVEARESNNPNSDACATAEDTIHAQKIRLSKDVLLCLFYEKVSQVHFHQKAEVMHFGVSKSADDSGFVKKKRNSEGKEIIGSEEDVVTASRVIDITALATALGKSTNKAEFAMNMIEGVPKVIFKIGDAPPAPGSETE